jgi:small subunit ribosomal protein S9
MDSHANTTTENAEGPSTTESAPPAATLPDLTLGSGGPAEEAAEPHAAPTMRGRIDRFGTAMGTGRRKTSVARVRIKRGNGKLTINNRTLEDYFRVERNRALVEGPLLATDMLGKVDIWVRAQGGGTTGQVGAVVLGIARALQAMDPGLHARLSEGNFLTRDGRMVERKKYGRKKARRSFQFSKR